MAPFSDHILYDKKSSTIILQTLDQHGDLLSVSYRVAMHVPQIINRSRGLELVILPGTYYSLARSISP